MIKSNANELCHKEAHWGKAMKQIIIKLAALGLLFSVVSTYACDSCGCNHKASESINVDDVEGKHRATGYPVLRERSNDDKMRLGEVNEDAYEF